MSAVENFCLFLACAATAFTVVAVWAMSSRLTALEQMLRATVEVLRKEQAARIAMQFRSLNDDN